MRRTKPPVGWERAKNCFPVPNELLDFDLPAGAVAVYICLLIGFGLGFIRGIQQVVLHVINFNKKELTTLEQAMADAAEEAAARALPDAKAAKRTEIQGGYDAALAASLTMPATAPTAQDVAVGAALLAVDDAEGLAFVQSKHAARRDELLAVVEAAETVEAVQAVVVDYDV